MWRWWNLYQIEASTFFISPFFRWQITFQAQKVYLWRFELQASEFPKKIRCVRLLVLLDLQGLWAQQEVLQNMGLPFLVTLLLIRMGHAIKYQHENNSYGICSRNFLGNHFFFFSSRGLSISNRETHSLALCRITREGDEGNRWICSEISHMSSFPKHKDQW